MAGSVDVAELEAGLLAAQPLHRYQNLQEAIKLAQALNRHLAACEGDVELCPLASNNPSVGHSTATAAFSAARSNSGASDPATQCVSALQALLPAAVHALGSDNGLNATASADDVTVNATGAGSSGLQPGYVALVGSLAQLLVPLAQQHLMAIETPPDARVDVSPAGLAAQSDAEAVAAATCDSGSQSSAQLDGTAVAAAAAAVVAAASEAVRPAVLHSCLLLLGVEGLRCAARLTQNSDAAAKFMQAQLEAANALSVLHPGDAAMCRLLQDAHDGPAEGPGHSGYSWLMPLAEHTASLALQPPLPLFLSPGGGAVSLDAADTELTSWQRMAVVALSLLQRLLQLMPELQADRAVAGMTVAAAGGAAHDNRTSSTSSSSMPGQEGNSSTGGATRRAQVTIEEVPDGAPSTNRERSDAAVAAAAVAATDRQAALVRTVVQLCAIYGPDLSSCSAAVGTAAAALQQAQAGRPAASNGTASGGEGNTLDLSDGGAPLALAAPWSNAAAQALSLTLLDTLAERCCLSAAAAVAAGSDFKASRQWDTSSSAGRAPATGGTGGRQGLFAATLPALVAQLRAIVIQKQLTGLGDAPMAKYSGPDASERAFAARQLAWLVRALRRPLLSEMVPSLLPPVLAATEDPSATVAVHGVHALHHLAVEALAADLQWQRELLVDVARRKLQGCEPALWGAVAPMAVALARSLEGRDVRSPVYHALMSDLLSEAERNAHKLMHRLMVLQVLPPLSEGLGLMTLRHFSRLMPLLLEWLQAYDVATRLATLQALDTVVRVTWPRMPAHGAILWQHLAAAYAREERTTGNASANSAGNTTANTPTNTVTATTTGHTIAASSSSACSAPTGVSDSTAGTVGGGNVTPVSRGPVQAAVVSVCELLVRCGGDGFRQEVLAAAAATVEGGGQVLAQSRGDGLRQEVLAAEGQAGAAVGAATVDGVKRHQERGASGPDGSPDDSSTANGAAGKQAAPHSPVDAAPGSGVSAPGNDGTPEHSSTAAGAASEQAAPHTPLYATSAGGASAPGKDGSLEASAAGAAAGLDDAAPQFPGRHSVGVLAQHVLKLMAESA